MDVEGIGRVSLNKHQNVYLFKGETVKGVPSLHPHLREMKDEQLFRELLQIKGHVESKETPPAPEWKAMYGKFAKELLGKYSKPGEIQIHHENQWARGNLGQIVQDYKAGKLTLEEAAEQTKKLVFKEKRKNKNGTIIEKYQIIPQPIHKRNYVALPAKLHDYTNRPLYLASHPLGIDIEAAAKGVFKECPYGIPKRGRAGRDWYATNFQPHFWREVYRREAFVLQQEINRRMRNGTLTMEQAKTYLKDAHEKLDKSYQYMLSLKQEAKKSKK